MVISKLDKKSMAWFIELFFYPLGTLKITLLSYLNTWYYLLF